MTAPTSTPAEQIERFIERHPGEWQAVGSPFVHGGAHDFPDGASLSTAAGYVVLMPGARGVVVNVSRHGHDAARVGQTSGADILTRISTRVADACQIYGVSADTLPPWLADPVRRHLRTRAGELLTLAGGSPADVVSAAETLDEALCGRPVVEVTGVLRALMSVGMSCRWATGADEAADDYVGFVSRRLDVVAEERDALAAKLAQVQAMQAAQEEYVTARMIAVRSVLRGVADEPRASQVTALDAADAYLVDALYRKPKTTETP